MSPQRVISARRAVTHGIRLGVVALVAGLVIQAPGAAATTSSSRPSYAARLVYADGTLVRGAASPKVYAIYAGVAHWIATATVRDLLGFASTPATVLPQVTVNKLPKGGTFVERFTANGLPDPLSPIRTVKGNIFTNPPSGPIGSVITLTGLGFAAGEMVQLNLAGGALVFQTRASVTGTIQTAVAVPATLSLGTYRITAVGLHSGNFAIEPYTVIPASANPTVAPSPTFAVPGGTFTASGGGFLPGEPLYLYDAQAYGVASGANATGGFGPVTLLVPGSVTLGVHSVWVYGVSSRYLARSTIVVAPPGPASVQATPASASIGSLETVSGAGFVPGEHVSLSIDGAIAGDVVADGQGAFAGAVITVPPGAQPGQVALTARGVTSGRASSTIVTVVALTPHLLVSPSSGAPGTALTIAGTGFAPDEGITLSFNGTALATTPPAIVADAQGNFFASTALPATAVSGPNTLQASGARSRAVATTAVDVRLPVAATWYFAGIDARPGADGQMAVLNPDNNPARLTVHVAFSDAQAHDYTVAAPAHARSTIDLAALVHRRTLCFVHLSADRRVAAAETTWRGGPDWSSAAGIAAPARTWYLAEGYTGNSFHEYLRLYNPANGSAGVTVRLLPHRGRTVTLRLTLAADSGTEIFVHRHLPGQAVAAIVTASRPIVVERAITFGRGNVGATEASGGTWLSATWFFADGSTARGFQTRYTVLNPNRHDTAGVTATFYSNRGTPLGTRTVIVGPLQRGSITANGAVRSGGFSAVLSSNVPVVAERVIYFGAHRGYAGSASDVPGHNGGSLEWGFPEGVTRPGYREYLVLQGTTGAAAAVSAEFYTTTGSAFPYSIVVPAHGRAVIAVNGVPGLPAAEHGALLSSTNGVPFLAEQSIYSADGTRGDAVAGLAQ